MIKVPLWLHYSGCFCIGWTVTDIVSIIVSVFT